ncbi:MAG: zinc-ribbon domain-containing protein [Deltaproteobacteria bacterium]|jgi:hypothetical protein|nr:zinc-ribbon domain-containing protein [Deltaproteobacteria bacterium]
MRVICPGCLAPLIFKNPEKPLGEKVWFRCPKCHERFKPQVGFLSPAFSQAWPRPAQNRFVSPKAIPRAGDYLTYDLFLGEAPISFKLPVMVERKKWAWLPMALLAMTFLTGLALVAFGFKASASQAWPEANSGYLDADTQGRFGPGQSAPNLADKWLASDLKALRSDLIRLRQVDKTVDYEGRETRVLKNFLGLLAPGACLEFKAIEIRSNNTSEGFLAKGLCANGLEAPELAVGWNLENAAVRVTGQSRVLKLSLNGNETGMILN